MIRFRPEKGFRRAALGLAAGAALLASPMAHAGDFTADQCRLIAATSGQVVKTVGTDKLSADFRKSILDFVMPEVDGKRSMTCEGSKNILTQTTTDIAAFGTIRQILLAPPNIISLEKAGLRTVDPREASRDQKRSELLPSLRPGS